LLSLNALIGNQYFLNFCSLIVKIFEDALSVMMCCLDFIICDYAPIIV